MSRIVYTLIVTEHQVPAGAYFGMRKCGAANAARDNARFVLARRSTA